MLVTNAMQMYVPYRTFVSHKVHHLTYALPIRLVHLSDLPSCMALGVFESHMHDTRCRGKDQACMALVVVPQYPTKLSMAESHTQSIWLHRVIVQEVKQISSKRMPSG